MLSHSTAKSPCDWDSYQVPQKTCWFKTCMKPKQTEAQLKENIYVRETLPLQVTRMHKKLEKNDF